MTVFDEIDASIAISNNGWCTREKARALALLVMALRPEVTVEIGVFTGKSAIAMALAHRHIGRGRVLAIDAWSAVAAAESEVEANREWWAKQVDFEAVYQEFTANAARFGVSGFIDIRRDKSDNVAPPEAIGLFHCDGNHSEPAYRDICRFAPHVIKGGVVVCDDIEWQGGHVMRGVDKLISMGFVELYRLGTGAVFQRAPYA